jgi:ABC-2 type transport system permease protein
VSKMWLVARHEFLTNVRRRSFLFAAFGAPLFTILVMYIVFAITVESFGGTEGIGLIGYVDESGVLAAAIDQPEDFRPYPDGNAARAAMDAGEIDGYFSLPSNYIDTGMVNLYLRSSSVPEGLYDQIDTFLIANIGSSVEADRLERLQDPVNTQLLTLDNGRLIRDSGIAGLFLTPIIFVMVFMLASQTSSGYLMSSVVEEKGNRIMEILITSVTPMQLLVGKIIGLGALGLLQLGIWMIGGAVALQLGQNTELLSGVYIPPDMLLLGLIYFLLTYFLIASLMAGIGATAGGEQESRQLSSIFSLLLFLPFFFLYNLITDPNGTISTILTLLPFTSPVTTIFRMAFGTVPTWQLVVSLIVQIVTTVLIMWAAARVFRWSLLMYGKRPNLRELVRIIRKPSGMGTTATGESAL